MRKEKGGKRGRKKMDEREKEGEVQERIEEVTGEGIEEIEERPEAIEEAVEEEERCEEDTECHSSAKRARVCATFTDSQEISIVEFVKNCMTRNIHVSKTGTEERLSGQKYLQD